MSNIQLAINLRRLRLDHDYTQKQIGEMLNLSARPTRIMRRANGSLISTF